MNKLQLYEEGKLDAFLEKLIASKNLPSHIKTLEQAFMLVSMGKELGFAPIQAMHYLIPIEGRITLSAKALNAILRKGGIKLKTLQDGLYIWPDGHTSKYSTRPDSQDKPIDRQTEIEFIRGEMVEICDYTWKDAEKQGLTDKSNWKKLPREMLYARCLSKGANRIGADLLLGLYMTEEIADSFRVDESLLVRNEEGFIEEVRTPPARKENMVPKEQVIEDISHEEVKKAD